jgi:hypothetical protein
VAPRDAGGATLETAPGARDGPMRRDPKGGQHHVLVAFVAHTEPDADTTSPDFRARQGRSEGPASVCSSAQPESSGP